MPEAKTIDFLFEDPEIPSQKYALVSIVGPHMKQKCDVWGLKIRGTADTIDAAKNLCKRLLRIDNNYDIYTVEVGKFFPLNVDPLEIDNIEYQNDQLNTLIKSYLENKSNANELWHKRKIEMIEEAINEGKNQAEFANKPEHPISVLQKIRNYEDAIIEAEKSLQSLKDDLEKAQDKFNNYTQDEKELALKEIDSAKVVAEEEPKSFSVEEIRGEIEKEINNKEASCTTETSSIEETLNRVKLLEEELEELQSLKNSLSSSSTPKVYNKIQKTISNIESELKTLKAKLNDSNSVNDYINHNYQNSQYNFD
jgi:DNA repair exonuclease SbcCD ATPase subunit